MKGRVNMETKAYWFLQLSCHMPQNFKNTKCPSRPSFKFNKRRFRAFWRFRPGLELSSCCSRLMSQGQPLPPKNSEFLKFIFPLSCVFGILKWKHFLCHMIHCQNLKLLFPGTKTPSWELQQSNNLYTITTTIPNPPNMPVFRTSGKQNFTPKQVKWWELEGQPLTRKKQYFVYSTHRSLRKLHHHSPYHVFTHSFTVFSKM